MTHCLLSYEWGSHMVSGFLQSLYKVTRNTAKTRLICANKLYHSKLTSINKYKMLTIQAETGKKIACHIFRHLGLRPFATGRQNASRRALPSTSRTLVNFINDSTPYPARELQSAILFVFLIFFDTIFIIIFTFSYPRLLFIVI